MKYTNNFQLPEYVCEWLSKDNYDRKDDQDVYNISATELLRPLKGFVLKKLHAPDVQTDYSDLIASRIGTAVHESFERANVADFQEKRLHTRFFGYSISGKFDMIIDGQLKDIKTTSVWKYIHREYQDYITQLSIYRWLAHRNNIELSEDAAILFYFTDWKKSDYQRNPGDYPACKMVEEPIKLMSYDETELFIIDKLGRITGMIRAIQDGGELPDCIPEELWQKPDKWAVCKKGVQRAIKLYDKEAEAAQNLKEGQEIRFRPGKVKFCFYCQAKSVCEQYKRMKEQNLIEE